LAEGYGRRCALVGPGCWHHLGISFATAARIWRRWGLQPWKAETFKFIVPRLSYSTSTGARPLGTARGVHDYGDTDEAYRGADDVEAVRAEPVDNHAPDQRPAHEHAPICAQNAARIGIGLQSSDEAVQAERDYACANPRQTAMFTDSRTPDLVRSFTQLQGGL
jgi:hypothetical protein